MKNIRKSCAALSVALLLSTVPSYANFFGDAWEKTKNPNRIAKKRNQMFKDAFAELTKVVTTCNASLNVA